MDPRHPEESIPRVDELIKQYKRILEDMRTAYSSHTVSSLEHEGTLVVQEICLTAPRLQDAMMVVSRTRRAAIARGIVMEPVENYVAQNQAETVIVEPKPRKKKTAKKKAKK